MELVILGRAREPMTKIEILKEVYEELGLTIKDMNVN